MNSCTKKILIFTLTIFLLIFFSGIASARNTGPVWHKGTVTKAAWTEGKDTAIEVDTEKYTFLLPLERVKIQRQFKGPGGQWRVEKLPLDKVYVGTNVLIRVEGLQIFQLTVEEP